MSNTIGTIVFIGLVFWAVFGIFGGEQEGTVSYYDCRQKVELKDGGSGTFFKKFTCDLDKANNGKIIGGECVHLDMDGSTCSTAYYYEKKSDIVCKENEQPNYEGTCSCKYGFVMKGGKCMTYDQDCQNVYGPNSYGKFESNTNSSCFCNEGYKMNNERTSCVSQDTLNSECEKVYGDGSYSIIQKGNNVCDCSYGYVFGVGGKCAKKSDVENICKTKYGPNSYYSGTIKDDKYVCN